MPPWIAKNQEGLSFNRFQPLTHISSEPRIRGLLICYRIISSWDSLFVGEVPLLAMMQKGYDEVEKSGGFL